jgi:hypothetical protein
MHAKQLLYMDPASATSSGIGFGKNGVIWSPNTKGKKTIQNDKRHYQNGMIDK